MAKGRIIFVTGTDTGVGKSYATGVLARAYLALGKTVITQKPVQTGTREPEDILIHRRMMGLPPDPPELLSLTCPYIFKYPAAPETAASLEGQKIDSGHLLACLRELSQTYEVVLVEGAGGLYVPLTEDLTVLDFISLLMCPVLVVSAARLGTINHTVLTIKALKARGLYVAGLIYNLHFATDEFLAERSLEDIKRLAEIDQVLKLPNITDEIPSIEALLSFVENTPGLRP
ncbi:dethiobiotin synthase [Thermosulfurimonas dismutans]|uniref:ATP-dependent dethiobiotin synthetase BioD n=1 Tax=Thermosulfurimonas dismutans TaxID=999894 RepID=A0A179D4U2_9BACT|nr:dethiobiotin synthase [Thermosulfurimonas dismutans]OAQ21110.1 Dethiobiotin synthetase [Thermosulfurimonas dismutans]